MCRGDLSSSHHDLNCHANDGLHALVMFWCPTITWPWAARVCAVCFASGLVSIVPVEVGWQLHLGQAAHICLLVSSLADDERQHDIACPLLRLCSCLSRLLCDIMRPCVFSCGIPSRGLLHPASCRLISAMELPQAITNGPLYLLDSLAASFSCMLLFIGHGSCCFDRARAGRGK